MTWKDGDDIDEKAAKEATKRLLEDPKHKRDKGSKDDLATVDDPLETGDDA
jgi:hypothetical protein